MRLSVILPCFNGAATIAVQLEALTRQSWDAGWEVIVVDNGSTDTSMQIVRGYADRLPGLRIVEAHRPGTPRLGVPHSYNTGIAAATGDAFVFCEADDEVAPGWLQAMGHALERHEFVVARLDHRKLNPPWLHPRNGEGYQSAGLAAIPNHPRFVTASACGFGLRRSLYAALGPLSIEFPIVHDGEYCWRAQAAGYAPHFEPAALIHYREREGLVARFRQGRSWGRDSTLLYAHYGPPLPRLAVLRRASAVVRAVPGVLLAALVLPFGASLGARQRLADAVWSMGWETGALLGTVQYGNEQRKGQPRGALSHVPSRSNAALE